MGLLSALVGGGVAPAVSAVGTALDALVTSDEERLAAEAVMEKLRQRPALLQAEINKLEAQHRTVFVAGWRPFIGWVCGCALAWNFLGHPMVLWAVSIWAPDVTPPPAVEMATLSTLVMSLLGLGGLRTFEKTNGAAR